MRETKTERDRDGGRKKRKKKGRKDGRREGGKEGRNKEIRKIHVARIQITKPCVS